MKPSPTVPITVWRKGAAETLHAERGATLKSALRKGDVPFPKYHCGGMGICGTCKVRVKEKGEWWERRSCQLRCFHAVEIEVE